MNNKEQKQKLSDEVRRANNASALLANPVFEATFTKLRDEVTRLRLQTAPTDVASREWFHMLEVALLRVEQELRRDITTGTMASLTLEHQNNTRN